MKTQWQTAIKKTVQKINADSNVRKVIFGSLFIINQKILKIKDFEFL